MSEIAGKYKLSNDLKNVQNVTGEMEDIEKIKTSHKKSSNILELKKRWSIKYCNNKLIQKKYQKKKNEVEDLQFTRYQGDLEAIMDRFNKQKVTEEGKKKLSTNNSSEKIKKNEGSRC